MDKEQLLTRRFERERRARLQAESILEAKALELYNANQELIKLNSSLEEKVNRRTDELKESEVRYRSLVESATDVIYNMDADGNFTYVSPAAHQLFGYTSDQLIGKNFTLFVNENYHDQLKSYFAEDALGQSEEAYMEFPAYRKDRSIAWVGQTIKKIRRDEDVFYSAIARDITDKKHAERLAGMAQLALEKSEQKYRSILENMQLGLIELNLSGYVNLVYPLFKEMFELGDKELHGKHFQEIFDQNSYPDILTLQSEQPRSNTHEIKITLENNTEKWLIISLAPFYDFGGIVSGYLLIHYDITSRKKLERELKLATYEAEQARNAESNFLANMSHEIRTPLNAIIGMSHLLNDTSLNLEQSDFLSVIMNSTNILHRLISDILDISKIESGRVEVNEMELDLFELVSSIHKTFKTKLKHKPVDIQFNFDPRLNHYVMSDELLLNQILLNLVGNAIKFTQEGHVAISVKQLESNDDIKKIEIKINDTGIGIRQEDLEVIFHEFKQASSEISKNFGGTGLGLAITKKLVEQLGGQISVDSKLGKGSQFVVTMDMEYTQRKLVRKEAVVDQIHPFKQQYYPVLVAEDNLMNQKYIGHLLSKWNVKFVMTANGREAVEAVDKAKFSLIFMDIQMPIMNGYEACKIIRQHVGVNRDIPIVALTASSLLSMKQKAHKYGMSDFISKPFIPKQLHRALKQHLVKDKSAKSTLGLVDERDLNEKVIFEIYQGDDDYMNDIFELFLKDTTQVISQIKNGLTQKDYTTVLSLVHAIKPSFTMVGITSITEMLETIEYMIKNKEEYETIVDKLSEVIREYQAFLPLVERKLQLSRRALAS